MYSKCWEVISTTMSLRRKMENKKESIGDNKNSALHMPLKLGIKLVDSFKVAQREYVPGILTNST